MDRREHLKLLLTGSMGAGLLASAACSPEEKKELDAIVSEYGRTPEEKAVDEALHSETFFTKRELAMVAILSDIIIPADETSGSATEAGVPEFIEFMMKDAPSFQTPIRGGLMWLESQCVKRFGKEFTNCDESERMEIIERIAWPEKAQPDMMPGVRFFNRMRNLVASGFFTTRLGIDDLGYMGNIPGVWDGVPNEVLAKHGLSYDAKTLAEVLDPALRGKLIEWDDKGNIIG